MATPPRRSRQASDRWRLVDTWPRVPLMTAPSPVDELARLRAAFPRAPRLLIKRDDAIPFGFGGNKVRKLEYMAARAIAEGADTLVTCGGVQSNHARATAATAAKLGLRAALILNGEKPQDLRGNRLLDDLLGAEVHYVHSRDEREAAMRRVAEALRASGRSPFEIPLGASTPLGALGLVRAVWELVHQNVWPDLIVHASSSGGTQAGLVVGCALAGLPARVMGISADDPADVLAANVRKIIDGMRDLIGLESTAPMAESIVVDDRFVGEGYGIPTAASREAAMLVARTEAIFLDPTYTAKAMAGLIALLREGRVRDDQTVLFWHTGGLPGLFA